MTRVSVVFILLFFCQNVFSQDTESAPDIYVYGFIEDYFSLDRLDSCSIVVYSDHTDKTAYPYKSIIATYPYDGVGAFEFYLKFDTLYTIEFSRLGYVSKLLSIDGRNIPKQARRFGFSMGPTEISLFKPIDNIDYSILKNPLGKARFMEDSKTFEYDTTYTFATLKMVNKLMDKHKVELKIPIHDLIDNWHHAAAIADEENYFGSMAEDAIFLGTDKTERWQRDVFEKWAQPHFEKDKAWAFTAKDRVIYFHKDYQLAWFEELLDTWMGTCRGSGVVELTDDGWKIKHYNLALLIDNDKMDKVIEVLESE